MPIFRGLSAVNRTITAQYRALSAVNRTIKEQYRGLSAVNRKVFGTKPAGALYWLGDKCTALTGGLTKYYYYGSGGLYVEEAEDIAYGDNSATAYSNMGVRTTNTIDLTNYTTLYGDLELTYSYCNGNGNSFVVGAGLTATGAFAASCGLDGYAVSAARAVYSVDISALNGSYYVSMRSSSGNYPDEQCYGKVYRMWVE